MNGPRKLAVAVVALLLVLALLGSFAGARSWGVLGPGWGMGPGMMGWGMGPRQVVPSQPAQPYAPARGVVTGGIGFSWELVIILVVAVILLAWLVVPRVRSVGNPTHRRETPLEIARRRYVTGEISLSEYEEILSTLVESGELLM